LLARSGDTFAGRRIIMVKVVMVYARYAFSALATVGFAFSMN
jgi:hypothetical protein